MILPMLLGLAEPLAALAAAGLAVLMVGAVITHVHRGEGVRLQVGLALVSLAARVLNVLVP